MDLHECWLDGSVDLSEARTSTLRLANCYLSELSLFRAHVGGDLDLRGARLARANSDGEALRADELTVAQSVLCGDGFRAEGRISLRRASVGGNLDLRGAHLANPDGEALRADELTVAQSVLCGHGFTAAGGISLRRASVGGDLDLRDAHLANPDGEALRADELTVNRMLDGRSLSAAGGISLRRASVGGDLDLRGADLANRHGEALRAESSGPRLKASCADMGSPPRGGSACGGPASAAISTCGTRTSLTLTGRHSAPTS